MLSQDPYPSRHTLLPIHHLCLFRLGVPLGEMWYLHELADWLREHDRQPLPADRTPAAVAGSGGLPADPRRDSVNAV